MDATTEIIQTIAKYKLTPEDFAEICDEILDVASPPPHERPDLDEDENEHRLALWVEEQRQAYKDGLLSDMQIKMMEELPNFTWESE